MYFEIPPSWESETSLHFKVSDPPSIPWHIFGCFLFVRPPPRFVQLNFLRKEGSKFAVMEQLRSRKMVEGVKWSGIVGRGLIDLIGGEESAIIARPPPQNSRFTMTTKMRKAEKLIHERYFLSNIPWKVTYIEGKTVFSIQFLCFSRLCCHRKMQVWQRRSHDDCRFMVSIWEVKAQPPPVTLSLSSLTFPFPFFTSSSKTKSNVYIQMRFTKKKFPQKNMRS